LAEPDDAAVYRIDERRAIIVTADFFPPVVDDPYWYGAIAAANAMSDVFAMGGEVLFALNIAAFPANLDAAILSEIMRGGADKSFGIQVARLAGLPDSVILRAKSILHDLENADINRPRGKRLIEEPQQQLSLLAVDQKNELLMELTHLDVDQLTPLEALNRLNDLHQRAKLTQLREA